MKKSVKTIHPRREFLVNPGFQFRFLGYMLVTAVVISGTYYGANEFFFREFEAQGRAFGLPPEHDFFAFINEQRKMMGSVFVTVSMITAAMVSIVGLVLSHRIAGPLRKLQNHMLAVASGRTDAKIHFRKNDEFRDLADAYNQQLSARRASPRKKRAA